MKITLEDKGYIKGIRIFSLALSVIGIIGIILLGAPNAYSQSGKKGFQSGDTPFKNPFADVQKDFEQQNPNLKSNQNPFGQNIQGQIQEKSRNRVTPQQVIRVNPKGSEIHKNDVPEPRMKGNRISVGGETSGGIISENLIPNISVDTQSAIGGSQIVTDFNFPDADIIDIAKTMGKLTGKNFILDKNVKGRITIISNSPITVSDAWKAFLTTLDINGYTVIQTGKYIRIARQRDARDKQLKTFTGNYSPNTDALITRVFPLKHIEADEIARVFRSFMPANSRVIPHNQTNTVIVTDTGSNIQKLESILNILDIEGFDAGIEVIPVKFASAVEIAKLIDALLPGQKSSKRRKSRPFGRGNFAARKTKEGGIINNIIADERTNSIIINANKKGGDQVRTLVVTLDKKRPARIGGGKINVVYLQFANAEDIAKTLTNLGSQRSTSRRKSKRDNPIQASLFKGEIKIAADTGTNSLVITASPSDFVTIQRVIAKLDIPRDEVYIEAFLLEMTLGDDFNFSANIASPTNGIFVAPKGSDLLSFITNPVASSGLVLGLKAGSEKSFNINGTSYSVSTLIGLIKAIQTESQTNILANPQILTLDNQEAVFEISERIPVPTTTSNQNQVVSSITKEDIGLSLKIKPQINKLSNFVKMEISAKMEDIANRILPEEVAQKAFATLNRKIETTVVVADGDTVVLGGLIRDKISDTIKKVPILGDIPILGWLFKAKEQTVAKTNLLMFISPKIIRKYEKTRAILDQKLKQRDDFIRNEAGSEDPLQKYRNNIIRSLPDMDEILDEAKRGREKQLSGLKEKNNNETESNQEGDDF